MLDARLPHLRSNLKHLYWLLIPLLTIPALWPLYTDGLPARFDRGLHLMRLAWLDHHIRQGTLFPRWVPEMMLGRGYPLLNFYGAGVYYLSETLHLLGLSLYDASIATLTVLALLAGFGMFKFTHDLFAESMDSRAPWASLVAAIAYVYAPYFLTVNIYQRGAIAEATAQALMPWVLWSARRIFTHPTPAHWAMALALLLASLVFSHTLMLLIFPPLLAGYIVVLWLQNGRSGRALAWAAAGIVVAIGLSAFFWLPLIIERDYLSKFAYGIVRGAFLPRSTWTWETFVADEWLYTYVRPPRLGRVQFLLGAAGALVMLARRRTWESGYLLLSALVAGALVGSWARPLWEASEILLSIQSPWRLLTLLSLVTAVCTGALVAYFPLRWLQIPLALALVAATIYANLPHLEAVPYFSATDTELPLHTLAQLEYEQGVETGGEGSTFVQEFRPLWASRNLIYVEEANLSAQPVDMPPLEIQPTHGNATTLTLHVTVSESGSDTGSDTDDGRVPLRFGRFYFPGWQVRLADGTQLPTYPSTNVGLMTVDLPPGDHDLTLTWTGAPTQRIAALVSVMALALLAAITIWRGRRPFATIPLTLLIIALFANVWRPALAAVELPQQPLEAQGIRLLGLRTEQDASATHLYLYPYWAVSATPSATLQARWQLQDESGVVHSELVSGPYFNASTPATWPPGTLIEDAYALPLPPGLAAGSYSLVLQLHAGGQASPAATISTVTLSSPTPPQDLAAQIVPAQALFDDEIRLAGFVPATGDDAEPGTGKPPSHHAGSSAIYRLYWQAVKTPSENYHSYIHLIDAAGHAIVHSDQLPGPWFRPPKGWDTYYLQQDTHRLEIPTDAPGGLYWPTVGMYEIRQMDRMAITVDGQAVEGDVLRLPPIKVIGAPAKPPIERTAHFDDGFHLLGYDLHMPSEGLTPGTPFAVTLYYRSDTPTNTDYTRFFHLYSPELGLAAGADSPPQAGVNPTSAWVAGETIVDRVSLQVSEDAAPGDYVLFTGFYDAQAGGVRLGVRDEAGQLLPDGGVVLESVRIEAR